MGKVTEIQPHWEDVGANLNREPGKLKIRLFLAGTIDCGDSRDWQREFIERMKQWSDINIDYYVYNPRREKGFDDDPNEFNYQVNWELEHLEKSDLIVMNILGTSKSPISLLELGLFARTGKLEVICEPDFYRYGNVKIVCEKYGIPLYESMDQLVYYNATLYSKV